MFQFHAGHGPSPWPSLFCPDLRPRYTPPVLALAPHPALHPAFESLGYASGYTLYKRSRQRHGDILPEPQRWSVIASAALGALLGSHIRGLLEQAPRTHLHLAQILLPGGGKTIVGGLLGGWLAVELAERLQGIHARTGDLFVLPLCLRIAVGRIGCLLAGLADDTFGSPSTLPWAINFGDGVPRHPPSSTRSSSSPPSPSPSTPCTAAPTSPNGTLFRLFLAAYSSRDSSSTSSNPSPSPRPQPHPVGLHRRPPRPYTQSHLQSPPERAHCSANSPRRTLRPKWLVYFFAQEIRAGSAGTNPRNKRFSGRDVENRSAQVFAG